MAGAQYQWLAAEVAGTSENLTAKLNELEQQGHEVFQVTAIVFPNAHGWMVVCRQEAKGAEAKAATSGSGMAGTKEKEKDKPPEHQSEHAKPLVRRGFDR